jgi:heme a synthase
MLQAINPVGSNDSPGRRWLHLAAWALTCATFPLVWMGGLVTSHGAGMSVPDWPNSFGYNMFALPWEHWLGAYSGGVFYEHSHRLLGTLAGLMAIGCAASAWGWARSDGVRRTLRVIAGLATLAVVVALIVDRTAGLSESQSKSLGHGVSGLGSLAALLATLSIGRYREARASLRWLALGCLLAVIVQGLMGGFRVRETSLTLAFLHGIFGQMVFGLAALLVVMSSKWWMNARADRDASALPVVRWVSLLIVALVVNQLVLGAAMRHDVAPGVARAAGLAIPDWPAHYGRLIPPTGAAELARVNDDRAFTLQLPRVTMGQVWLHFAHRIGAYLTLIVVITTAVFVLRRGVRGVRWAIVAQALLVLAQATLGVLTVVYRKPADIASAHQATGALLLAASAVVAARAWRLYDLRPLAEVRAGSVSAEPGSAGRLPHLLGVPSAGAEAR